MHGADKRYRPGPTEGTWLCPECLSSLAVDMQHRRTVQLTASYNNAVVEHMLTITTPPNPGAVAAIVWIPLQGRAARR